MYKEWLWTLNAIIIKTVLFNTLSDAICIILKNTTVMKFRHEKC